MEQRRFIEGFDAEEKVTGMENFGTVTIRNVKLYNNGLNRWTGEVLVPRNYPGSSNVGAPNDNVSIYAVCSYDNRLTWETC